jgi:hypothetical protein
VRRTIALAAGLIAAASLTLAGTGAATAAPRHHAAPVVSDYSGTKWYIENDESVWEDPGINNAIYSAGPAVTTWEFTNGVSADGQTWYLARINDGVDCAQLDNEAGTIVDKACNASNTAQDWRVGGNHIQSLWYTNDSGEENWVYQVADECSTDADLTVFPATDPSNCADQWYLDSSAAHQGAGHGADGECKDGPSTVYCHT